MKIQREFEANNPGPLKHKQGKARQRIEIITTSDDEPDEQLGKMGDDWTNAIWDELVREEPQHWDMYDALRLGKRLGEDPSGGKREQPTSNNIDVDTFEAKGDNIGTTSEPVTFVDARQWKGKDLNLAVEEGHITSEQASGIMKLRVVVGDAEPPTKKIEGEVRGARQTEVPKLRKPAVRHSRLSTLTKMLRLAKSQSDRSRCSGTKLILKNSSSRPATLPH